MRRSLQLVLVGLLCVGVGAAGIILAWRAVNDGRDVWVAARPLTAGQVITDADVRPAHVVVGNNVDTWPVSQPIAGQVVVTGVDGGALLTPANVGDAPTPSDLTRVGVVVDVGRAPVASLHVGDAVTLMGPDGGTVAGVMASAPVLLPDAARHQFDVDVTWTDAPRLAAWVGLGQVVVVKP